MLSLDLRLHWSEDDTIIAPPPPFVEIVEYIDDLFVDVGTDVPLDVIANGNPQPLNYQWYFRLFNGDPARVLSSQNLKSFFPSWVETDTHYLTGNAIIRGVVEEMDGIDIQMRVRNFGDTATLFGGWRKLNVSDFVAAGYVDPGYVE